MALARAYPVLSVHQARLFWSKVDRRAAGECWPWAASTKGRGYGAVRVNKQALSAHRVAWELTHGPVPVGQVVYQVVCNAPACCNPAHMTTGSMSDAMRAASAHGTQLGRGVGSVDLGEAPVTFMVAKPIPRLTAKQTAAFWAKVNKDGPQQPHMTSRCWVWTAAQPHGYGAFRVAGRNASASRVSYAIQHGDPPTHLDVCHKCDYPPCVNPDHLFTDNRKGNMQDAVSKGRTNPARGEAAGNAKLTETQVLEIRAARRLGESTITLAAHYGVTTVTISNIATRKSWRHLPAQPAVG